MPASNMCLRPDMAIYGSLAFHISGALRFSNMRVVWYTVLTLKAIVGCYYSSYTEILLVRSFLIHCFMLHLLCLAVGVM